MRRTRLSLFYLAGYLLPTGLLLLVAPRVTLRLLQSNGDYGSDVFVRVAGLLLLAIGIIVVQIIRRRVEALYPTTLLVRALFLVAFPRPAVPGHSGRGGARFSSHRDELLGGSAGAAKLTRWPARGPSGPTPGRTSDPSAAGPATDQRNSPGCKCPAGRCPGSAIRSRESRRLDRRTPWQCEPAGPAPGRAPLQIRHG